MATLNELITGLRYEVLKGTTSCVLAGITADSREVQPGWAFVAIPGVKVDGHIFIAQALAQGGQRRGGRSTPRPDPPRYRPAACASLTPALP
jgi:hypothetical protein